MELVPDHYYRTKKGNLLKYSFPMMSRTEGKKKYYMFWDEYAKTTRTLTELEIQGLVPDEGCNIIYG